MIDSLVYVCLNLALMVIETHKFSYGNFVINTNKHRGLAKQNVNIILIFLKWREHSENEKPVKLVLFLFVDSEFINKKMQFVTKQPLF